MKYNEVYSSVRLVSFVFVVVILDSTLVFQSAFVSSTTVCRSVPGGISVCTFWQACAVEIQEIPTRDTTRGLLKVNRLPTRVAPALENADPLACSTLPLASVPL